MFDSSGVVCFSAVDISDLTSVNVDVEFSCVLLLMPVLIPLTEVLSVRNPLDSVGVVCSSPIDICDVDFVDVDAEFLSVVVVIPELVSLVELDVVF